MQMEGVAVFREDIRRGLIEKGYLSTNIEEERVSRLESEGRAELAEGTASAKSLSLWHM